MTQYEDYIVVTKEFAFKGDDTSKTIGATIWLDDSATVSIKGFIIHHYKYFLKLSNLRGLNINYF